MRAKTQAQKRRFRATIEKDDSVRRDWPHEYTFTVKGPQGIVWRSIPGTLRTRGEATREVKEVIETLESM